jgi:hypothetical protein
LRGKLETKVVAVEPFAASPRAAFNERVHPRTARARGVASAHGRLISRIRADSFFDWVLSCRLAHTSKVALMHIRHGLLIGAGFAGCLVSVACAGSVDTAECIEDSECEHLRGGYCDTVAANCKTTTTTHTSTKENPEVNFTGEETIFFRGLVCTAKNGAVQTGTGFAVNVFPCLHPCLTIEDRHPAKLQTSCHNTTCESFLYRGYVVSGTNCPADVFGSFDKSMCNYGVDGIGLTVDPIAIEGQHRESFIQFEMPFHTNEDAALIAGLEDSQKNNAIKTMAYDYPLDESRRFLVEVRDEFAQSMCEKFPNDDDPLAGTTQDPQCTCYEVGFNE